MKHISGKNDSLFETSTTSLRISGFWFLALALPLMLLQAILPIESFIHRGDDAYYYFQLATNYTEYGFWTYDGIHASNGVQPLWAYILTGLAQVFDWIGVRDKDVLARIFVALSGCLNFASCVLLYQLMYRKVSFLTGIVAAGAFIFPMGIVWSRLWGLESSLYALTLVGCISYFHLRFLPNQSIRGAIILGTLLAMTALSRLNAGLFIALLLLYYLGYPGLGPRLQRFRLSMLVGAVASAWIVPYFIFNYVTTDHLLPVSRAVKAITAQLFLDGLGVDSVFSVSFLKHMYEYFFESLKWFVSSRIGDAFWPLGSRVVFGGDSGISLTKVVIPGLVACLLGPALFGQPRQWFRFSLERFKRLGPFVYVLAYGVLDVLVSVTIYPNQLGYSLIRWWWIENELILVVLTSTLLASALSYTAQRFLSRKHSLLALSAVMVIFYVFHGQQSIRYYWNIESPAYDWRLSWNDESYMAAQWLNKNISENAIVGSWNAGVIGYYSRQRVVNLDGLINSFSLVPYIAEDNVAQYIIDEGIEYLSDLEPIFENHVYNRGIGLTEVYRHYSTFMNRPYIIYRVNQSSGP